MSQVFRAAAVQLSASSDKKTNLQRALKLIARAAGVGARVIALPENFLFRGTDRQFRGIPEGIDGPAMTALRTAAASHRTYLLAGSFAELVPGSRKTYNTSCLIAPSGRIESVYRKIHLFDVDLPASGRSPANRVRVRESDRCLAGRRPVTGLLSPSAAASGLRGKRTASLRCGLSICYDLRFPELYRQYALLGAKVLFVPSNFTRRTGRDHWEPLLRARAIENQCFVIAPGQSGPGSQGVLSHGTSLILGPWGETLAKAPGSGEKVIWADLDLAHLDRVRRTLPSLAEASHR